MSKLDNLLLHPKTKKQLSYFLQRPVSPLLILGESGSGKLNLAYVVAYAVLSLNSDAEISSHPYFFHAVKPEDKQDISIDTIREINRFLRLKTPGDSPIRRVVLIENSHFLSHPAQNALLKMLEEPSTDSLFILTAPHELNLLPTIVSRCQHIWTRPVTMSQADKVFGTNFSQKKIEAAWRLSNGNASLLKALLTEEDSHPLKQAIEKAKFFLRQRRYQRLLVLERTSRNKDELRLFLEALSKILTALYRGAADKNRSRQAQNLIYDRRLVLGSIDAFGKNANIRLLCLNLVLKLKS